MQQYITSQNLKTSLIGGLLLAIATSINYILLGNITGMSGLINVLSSLKLNPNFFLKLALLAGLFYASSIVSLNYIQQFIKIQPFDAPQSTINSYQYLIAGLLVGLGTNFSSGCTSGHGLCGLPRFSLRSFIAVMIFLPTAVITSSYKLKQYLPVFYYQNDYKIEPIKMATFIYQISLIIIVLIIIGCIFTKKWKLILQSIITYIVGIIFGFGLMISGMTKQSKIQGFLNIYGNWDASLLFVLFTGVLINVITFNFTIKSLKRPLFSFELSNIKGRVDFELIIGSILFGVGWGLGSMCPGPLLMNLSKFSINIHGFWLLGCIMGIKIVQFVRDLRKVKTN